MTAAYEEFIKRLIAYRKANGYTQAEMGKRSNLTQSHYNKIENMSKVMSCKSLAILNDAGINADFLVTGIEPKHTAINDLLKQCRESDRSCFLYVTAVCIEIVIMHNRIKDTSYREISTKEIEILRSDIENRESKDHSIWKTIRKLNSLTQEQMSKELDIDIKTYRDIEKGKSKPNVEILATVYDKLGYPPSLILDVENKNYLYVINEIWLRLSEDLQNKTEEMLRSFFDFISII